MNYYRYAESARVNWITNFSVHVDPKHRQQCKQPFQLSRGAIVFPNTSRNTPKRNITADIVGRGGVDDATVDRVDHAQSEGGFQVCMLFNGFMSRRWLVMANS